MAGHNLCTLLGKNVLLRLQLQRMSFIGSRGGAQVLRRFNHSRTSFSVARPMGRPVVGRLSSVSSPSPTGCRLARLSFPPGPTWRPVSSWPVCRSVHSDKTGDEERLRRNHESLMTIPNIITTGRIILTPYIGYCVLAGQYDVATGLFFLAGLSDWVDGYIARNWEGQTSIIGAALDPFADKMLVLTMTFSLAYVELIPAPLAGVIVLRDVGLLVASFVIRYLSLKKHNFDKITWSLYWNMSYPTVQVTPTTISKANTFLQIGLLFTSCAAPVVPELIPHEALTVMWYTVGATTIASGTSYLTSKDAVRYLPPPEDPAASPSSLSQK